MPLGALNNSVTTSNTMKKKFIILLILLFCLFNKTVCLAQNGDPSYSLNNIMREILTTRIDVLDDTLYFNQQMPYYKKLYNMLNDSAKLDLLESSTRLWYNAGFSNEKDSIRGDELNFYITISKYFQHFYAEEQKRKHVEKWEKEVGDSLHFVFNVDSNTIPSSKYRLYCVATGKDNQQKKVYPAKKGASAIRIQEEDDPVDYLIIVKYRNKYIPVNKICLQEFSGVICYCNLTTKKELKSRYDRDVPGDNIMNLDAYVQTVTETSMSTGIETKVRIDNLRKTSKEYKKSIK